MGDRSFAQRSLHKHMAALCLACAITAPQFAMASVGGADGGHQPSILDLGWFYANFILYCLVIFFFLRGVCIRGWDLRRERIASSVERGSRAAAAARVKFSEAQSRFAVIESEIEAIERRILEDSAAESQKIIEDAKSRARALVTQAQQLAESEKRATEGSVHREFAKSIIDEARRRMHALIDPRIDEVLRSKVLAQSRDIVQ